MGTTSSIRGRWRGQQPPRLMVICNTRSREPNRMSEFLQVEKVIAGYGEAVILHDISLGLAQGETLALLGRNGTGKTTLMNTLAGATRQHAGSIMLGGVALH